MKLLKAFISRYPFQSIFLASALLLAGIADGIGLSSLLPALQLTIAGQSSGAPQDGFVQRVHDVLASAGITPTLGLLLAIILGAMVVKNVLIFVAEQRIGYIAADVATETYHPQFINIMDEYIRGPLVGRFMKTRCGNASRN